jgi:hypothetical protein
LAIPIEKVYSTQRRVHSLTKTRNSKSDGSIAIVYLIFRRFLARILTNSCYEAIASYYLTPLRRDEFREVETGFNTKGYHNKLSTWLLQPVTVYQTEFRSIITDLTHAIENSPSADDSCGQVSSSGVPSGAVPHEDITEEDSGNQDSSSDKGSLNDNLDEKEENVIKKISINPLLNMKYWTRLDKSVGLTLDGLLKSSN